jgi:hypothetical protein
MINNLKKDRFNKLKWRDDIIAIWNKLLNNCQKIRLTLRVIILILLTICGKNFILGMVR